MKDKPNHPIHSQSWYHFIPLRGKFTPLLKLKMTAMALTHLCQDYFLQHDNFLYLTFHFFFFLVCKHKPFTAAGAIEGTSPPKLNWAYLFSSPFLYFRKLDAWSYLTSATMDVQLFVQCLCMGPICSLQPKWDVSLVGMRIDMTTVSLHISSVTLWYCYIFKLLHRGTRKWFLSLLSGANGWECLYLVNFFKSFLKIE